MKIKLINYRKQLKYFPKKLEVPKFKNMKFKLSNLELKCSMKNNK